jgi:hypothetical protein
VALTDFRIEHRYIDAGTTEFTELRHFLQEQCSYIPNNITAASRLIESLLMDISIGSIWVERCVDNALRVIDGHKRLGIIFAFINNTFALEGLQVFSDYEHCTFQQLGRHHKRRIMERDISIYILEEATPDIKEIIIQRLKCSLGVDKI